MNTRIAIIAALPREIAELVRGFPADPELQTKGIYLHRLPNASVVAAGMGADRAALALQAALAVGKLEMLVSAGLAGSCIPGLHAGEVAEAGVVVDCRSGARYTTARETDLLLVSAPEIANVREKARLSRNYLASMVDMEAATVARLAKVNGLAFRAIKGISDAHDFELEGLTRFSGKYGEFRTGAFALHTALRPMSWGKAMELGRNSKRALAEMTQTLKRIIAPQ